MYVYVCSFCRDVHIVMEVYRLFFIICMCEYAYRQSETEREREREREREGERHTCKHD